MHLANPEIEYHRNGVTGAGFYVVTFDLRQEPRSRRHAMIATVFDAPGHVAVLSLETAQAGQVSITTQKWRGDDFEPWLRTQIARREAEAIARAPIEVIAT